jgi:hypothetical protein
MNDFVFIDRIGTIEGLYHGLRAAIKIAKDIANGWKENAITVPANTPALPPHVA